MWHKIYENRKNPAKSRSASVNILADEFNNFFVDAASSIVGQFDGDPLEFNLPAPPPQQFSFNNLQPHIVLDIISGLKNSKGLDVYGLPTEMVKKGALALVFPLTHLMNESIDLGIFPQVLKVAEVIPFFKTGDIDLPSNHWSVSKLPVFSKVLEKGLKRDMSTFFKKKKKHILFSDLQFGFRTGRQTKDAVLNFTDFNGESFHFNGECGCDFFPSTGGSTRDRRYLG